MHPVRRGRVWLLCSVLALVLAAGSSLTVAARPAAASTAADPVRILLLGDSLLSGSSGDWTWRYRLWKHLQATGASVDLVGPEHDLLNRSTGAYGNNAYVDPDFDRDYAGRWGDSLTYPRYSPAALVADHHPDVVVVALGVNDLGGAQETPDQVAALMSEHLRQWREADPTVELVVTRIGHSWVQGAAAYNQLLPGVVAAYDTPEARAVTTRAPGLRREIDTYDGTHLTATGETRVAAAVADGLAALGVGAPAVRPVPPVPNGPRFAPQLKVRAQRMMASVRWVLPPGADRVVVQQRRREARHPRWRTVRDVWTPRRGEWTAWPLKAGNHYEFRVRAAKGTALASDLTSRVVRVHIRPH